jgi:ferredoxin
VIQVRFRLPDGSERQIGVAAGSTLLEASREAGIELEGACGGSMACATCHVRIPDPWFDLVPAPSPEEEDMLDLAPDWQPTSRLGCQIRLDRQLDGIVVDVPVSSLLDY